MFLSTQITVLFYQVSVGSLLKLYKCKSGHVKIRDYRNFHPNSSSRNFLMVERIFGMATFCAWNIMHNRIKIMLSICHYFFI